MDVAAKEFRRRREKLTVLLKGYGAGEVWGLARVNVIHVAEPHLYLRCVCAGEVSRADAYESRTSLTSFAHADKEEPSHWLAGAYMPIVPFSCYIIC